MATGGGGGGGGDGDRDEEARWGPAILLDFARPEFATGLSLEHYIQAVDGALALSHRSATKFESLKICFQEGLRDDHLGSWLQFAASKRTRKLDLICNDLVTDELPVSNNYDFYEWLYYLGFSRPLHRMIQLPLLRILSLTRLGVTDDIISSLLVGCPTLGTLKLKQLDFVEVVRLNWPPFLHTLTVVDCKNVSKIILKAAELKTFHFKNFGSSEPEILFNNVSALEDVVMSGFCTREESSWAFLSFYTRITSLAINEESLLNITHLAMEWLFRKTMPDCCLIPWLMALLSQMRFSHLKSLEIFAQEDVYTVCWLLHCSWMPSLEFLFIEFLDGAEEYMSEEAILMNWQWFETLEWPNKPWHLVKYEELTRLREITVVGFESREYELTLMATYLFRRAPHLDILWLVATKRTSDPFNLEDEHASFLGQLRGLPKSSPRAEVCICHVDEDLVAMPASSHSELLRCQ